MRKNIVIITILLSTVLTTLFVVSPSNSNFDNKESVNIHDLRDNTSNTSGLINPDDELEDAVSEYSIQLLDTIYIHEGINAVGLVSDLSKLILLKNGLYCNEKITVTATYGTFDNTEDFEITINITLPDGVKYQKDINVEIFNGENIIGFAMLEDNTLIGVSHHDQNLSRDDVYNSVREVLNDKFNITNPTIEIPDDLDLDFIKTFDVGTYNGNTITFINSGSGRLNYSSIDKPIDQTNIKEGIHMMYEVYYTDNYDVRDVVSALGKSLVMENGNSITEDFTTNATIDSIGLHLEVFIGGIEYNYRNIDLIEVDESTFGSYIFAKPIGFTSPVFIMEKRENNNIMFDDIFTSVFNKQFSAIKYPSFTTHIDLHKVGSQRVKGVYESRGDNFFNYDVLVEVVNMEERITNSNVNITYNGQPDPKPDPDANTNYSIVPIKEIYIDQKTSIRGLIYSAENDILLKSGAFSNEEYSLSIIASNESNKEDYTVNIVAVFPDFASRTYSVSVKIVESDFQMGVIVLENGNIITATHINNRYTQLELKEGLTNLFIDELDMQSPNIELEDESFQTTETFHDNTYGDNKQLIIVISGLPSFYYSSEDTPVDDEKYKAGYNLYEKIYYTASYTIYDVLRIMGNDLLLSDGKYSTMDYKIEYYIMSDNNVITKIIVDDEVIIEKTLLLVPIDDSTVGNYIYATASKFKNSILLLEQRASSDKSFNEIFSNIVMKHNGLYSFDDITENVDVTTLTSTTIKGIFNVNTNYYNYETFVRVVDMDYEKNNDTVEITTSKDPEPEPEPEPNPNPEPEPNPDEDKDTEQPKEDNNILNIILITSGSVLGVGILYLAYKGYKSSSTWLKD